MLNRALQSFAGVVIVLAFVLAAQPAAAVPMIVGGANEGVSTDLFDVAQGGKIVTSTPTIPNFAPRTAIGGVDTGENGRHLIFADNSANPGTVTFRTPTPIDLQGYNLYLAQDGAAINRGAVATRLYASPDGINFTKISDTADATASLSNYQTNFGSGSITVSDTLSTTAQFFRLEADHALNSAGTRVWEIDALATKPFYIVDPILFNAASNTGSDEAPGLSVNFNVSSRVQGTDTPEDAFGNTNGAVEGSTFIFGDAGTNDNGNGIIGDGGETVDFIEWNTTSPIRLAGFQLNVSGDGTDALPRGTELVRFLVNNVQTDLFDNNHLSGTIDRLFAGGPVTGDTFRIEFTRTQGSPRIIEINAIIPIPEPTTLGLLATSALALLRRRRLA